MQSAALACLFSPAPPRSSSPPQLRPLRRGRSASRRTSPRPTRPGRGGRRAGGRVQGALDEEGGETAFRLKTDANNLAESAKETASAGSKIANLLDVGGRRGPRVLDPGSWNLTVAFFVGHRRLGHGAVVNRPPSGGNDPYIYNNAGYGGIDKFTSDGQPLEFGSRY